MTQSLLMAHQVTYGESRLPQACGDITRYESWCGSVSRQCIYVNGILNSDSDHQSTCKSLAHIAAASVLGVFNKSGLVSVSDKSLLEKFLQGDIQTDLLECLQDWRAIMESSVGLPKAMTLNKSVASLYYLLRLTGNSWPMSPLVIVAHSQGNLVASNALFLYSHMVKKHQLKHPNIHVVGLASPAPSWPTNDFIQVKLFTHSLDLVPYLSLGRSGVFVQTPAYVPYKPPKDVTISENSASHEVDSYLDDQSVFEWLWTVLKTPESVQKVIRKEMEEAKKKQEAEAAEKKKKAGESMAKFNKFSDLGPKY